MFKDVRINLVARILFSMGYCEDSILSWIDCRNQRFNWDKSVNKDEGI